MSTDRFRRAATAAMKSVPPVDAQEALENNLFFQLKKALGPRMSAIAEKMASLAESGDKDAMEMVVAVAMADKPSQKSSTTHMQQAVIVNGQHKKELISSEARRQIVCMIATQGPQQTERIAKALYLSFEEVAGVMLDHPWFEKQADGWHVTNQARTEVLPEGAQALLESSTNGKH